MSTIENQHFPKYVFHGGCFGCTLQEDNKEEIGVDICVQCQYFKPDWDLPDLNNRPMSEVELLKKRLIKKHKLYEYSKENK